MDVVFNDNYFKQLASYVEVQDVMQYLYMHPEELELTAREDFNNGLITKDELEYELKLVEKIMNEKAEKEVVYGR